MAATLLFSDLNSGTLITRVKNAHSDKNCLVDSHPIAQCIKFEKLREIKTKMETDKNCIPAMRERNKTADRWISFASFEIFLDSNNRLRDTRTTHGIPPYNQGPMNKNDNRFDNHQKNIFSSCTYKTHLDVCRTHNTLNYFRFVYSYAILF